MTQFIKPPVILCKKCGHTIKYHAINFGTSCEFYRCYCKGWELDIANSECEYLTLDADEHGNDVA